MYTELLNLSGVSSDPPLRPWTASVSSGSASPLAINRQGAAAGRPRVPSVHPHSL